MYDGEHSQLIEINTSCHGSSQSDRYAGIYQTVAVVPGETYELSLHGMLRALEDDPDRGSYSYRVQYGIDYGVGPTGRSLTIGLRSHGILCILACHRARWSPTRRVSAPRDPD